VSVVAIPWIGLPFSWTIFSFVSSCFSNVAPKNSSPKAKHWIQKHMINNDRKRTTFRVRPTMVNTIAWRSVWSDGETQFFISMSRKSNS
jgi:hypothetical protein